MARVSGAVVAAGTLCAVGPLTGCSSSGNKACTANLAIGRHAVVVGSGIPSSATAHVCDQTGCSSVIATTTDRVEVPLDGTIPSALSTITANVWAHGSQIAAPVTAIPTASPSTQMENGCDVGVDYRYTVRVTPTP